MSTQPKKKIYWAIVGGKDVLDNEPCAVYGDDDLVRMEIYENKRDAKKGMKEWTKYQFIIPVHITQVPQ